ncbi:MAG TPA: tRNA (guanosine(37)-N1)-methyltransferase TrmD [Candidatus Paceibacterota bacterium]
MSSIMRFDIITIFPKIFDSYFNESIIKRAQEKGKVKIKTWNLRDFTKDKHKKVDDRPFGGGPGMVMKVEPLLNCIQKLLEKISKKQVSKTLIILFVASGKQFDNKMAQDFSKKYEQIIMICGHYEGVDERIKNVLRTMDYGLKTISIGPYVLTGGELPSMIVVDAVSRQISGVLGKFESLEEKRDGIGIPVYTRPEILKFENKKYSVPNVLLSGNHKKIDEWRAKHRK